MTNNLINSNTCFKSESFQFTHMNHRSVTITRLVYHLVHHPPRHHHEKNHDDKYSISAASILEVICKLKQQTSSKPSKNNRHTTKRIGRKDTESKNTRNDGKGWMDKKCFVKSNFLKNKQEVDS